MTRRLFYEDAYIDAFDAVVTACEMIVDAWSVTLDRTAFYPEGGGQPAIRARSAACAYVIPRMGRTGKSAI